jgi:hypothetical protein
LGILAIQHDGSVETSIPPASSCRREPSPS